MARSTQPIPQNPIGECFAWRDWFKNLFNTILLGVVDGSNAAAGQIGEFHSGTASSSGVTNNTLVSPTSIALTAGDWDVWGYAEFLPAATTTVSQFLAGYSPTAATLPLSGQQGLLGYNNTALAAGTGSAVWWGPIRITQASSSTAYLTVRAVFGVSTCTVSGAIYARRVR